MVQIYALNAENRAVTVKNVRTRTLKLFRTQSRPLPKDMYELIFCGYCQAPSEFEVSCYTKKEFHLEASPGKTI